MKFLENPKFEAVNTLLSVDLECCSLDGRIEAYSCKMAGQEKRLFKQLSRGNGQTPDSLQALSPPQSTPLAHSPGSASTAYGSSCEEDGIVGSEFQLCETISTRMLFYLIATLNASFSPDYDFSNANSDEFSKEPSIQVVMMDIDTRLSVTAGELFTSAAKDQLWIALDEEIDLSGCSIYSYNPDLSSDPFGEDGCIWSFNYFFFNAKLRRIAFFTCRAISHVDRLLDGNTNDHDSVDSGDPMMMFDQYDDDV